MRERERSGRWRVVAMVFAGCWLASTVAAAQPRMESLRLAVDPERESVVAGTTLRVTIGLRDAHDRPAPAPSAFVVTIAVLPPVAGVVPEVTIPAGQPAATLQLTPSAFGILQIRAMHPQAFEGGAFVRVAPPDRGAPRTVLPPLTPPGATDGKLDGGGSTAIRGADSGRGHSPAPSAPPRSPGASPGRGDVSPRPHGQPSAAAPSPETAPATRPASGGAPTAAPAPGTEPAVGAAPPVAPPPATEPSPGGAPAPALALQLRYSPQRKLLADGRDAATIHVFPAGAVPSGGLKVNLFASSGTLTAPSFTVQEDEGHSTLTSDRPGDVDVELVGSQPHAEVEGERHLRIHFSPPIHGVRLEAKPAAISLVDETELIVTLIDAEGRAVATDEPRAVLLALDNGHGEIAREELTVAPGKFEARTRFGATSVGAVEVSAASASLMNQIVRLEVRLPLGLLAISVVGGLVGGLLAFLRRRKARWTRVATGGVTGFLLYWAFIFGLIRVMARGFVLNPLSDFALSTIGGWLGTEVFTLLLQRLGLIKHRDREDHGRGKREPEGKTTHGAGGA